MVVQWPGPYRIFVKCVRGLEGALEQELLSFGFHRNHLIKSKLGISIEEGSLRKLYFLSYFSRIASGVFVEARSFPVKDKTSFTDSCSEVRWNHFLKPDSTFLVNANIGDRSGFLQSGLYASQLVKDGVSHFFGRHLGKPAPTISLRDPSVRLHVHLDKGEASLLVDAMGPKTSGRPYRYNPALDDINPTVAVALLHDMGFTSHRESPFSLPLYESICDDNQTRASQDASGLTFDDHKEPNVDNEPSQHKGGALVSLFSGCGTFLIEAAMIAAKIAPGMLTPSFGFQQFGLYDRQSFYRLVEYASRIRLQPDTEAYRSLKGKFIGIESNWEKVEAALYSADRAGVMDLMRITRSEYLKDGLYDAYRERQDDEKWSFLIAQMPKLGTRFTSIPDHPGESWSDFIASPMSEVKTQRTIKAGATLKKNRERLQLDPSRYHRLACNLSKFRQRFFDSDANSLVIAPKVVELAQLAESFGCELRGGKHFLCAGIPCVAYHSRDAKRVSQLL